MTETHGWYHGWGVMEGTDGYMQRRERKLGQSHSDNEM